MGTQHRLPAAQPPGRWLTGRRAPGKLQPPPAQGTPEHGHAGLGDGQAGCPAWGWALRSVRPDSGTKAGPRPAWRSRAGITLSGLQGHCLLGGASQQGSAAPVGRAGLDALALEGAPAEK